MLLLSDFQASDVDSWFADDLNNHVLRVVKCRPSPNGKYTTHSIRIGARTEQVLLGLSLEVRFGWGADSSSMAVLYFDRTVQLTATSCWFFGAKPSVGTVSGRP